MPGIAGIISAPHEAGQSAAAVEQMTRVMMHEPFYASGTHCSDVLNLCVGWTSFHPSSSAVMPVWNENRDVAIVITGELFPDQDMLKFLQDRGHDFDSRSRDWIVHLYEEEGSRFLERLNGRFSGVLLDLRTSITILFNDRYGLERLYYHQSDRGFYFSSEAKSLLKVFPETRELNRASLAEFFLVGCPLENRSLFTDISVLPAGSMWIFSPKGDVRKSTYFDKRIWEQQERLTPEEYYESLKELFPRVLRKYLCNSKTIGISLTGGIDSRMIMAWAEAAPGFLPCYTFGSAFRESTDVTVGRKVAEICHQPHQVIQVADKFLSEFPTLAEQTVYITDGAMDVTGAPDLFANRIARDISPVRLTGNYGSEILRELVAFKPQRLHEHIFDESFTQDIINAGETYQRARDDHRLSFIAFKQVPWHHYSRFSLEKSQIVIRSPYLDNEIVQLAYRVPDEWAGSNEPALRLISDGRPELGTIDTDRGLLPKPVPVLSRLRHGYQEFTFKAEYAYDYGMPDWLVRADALFRPLHLERFFLGRHKFYHFRLWYRTILSSYLKEILLDQRTLSRPFFRRGRLEAMVHDHTSGKANCTLEIHRALSLELLHRTLLDAS
jgi:asparagine synthase (glutamine-hydrolysing)